MPTKVLWRQARRSIFNTSLLLIGTAFLSFRVLHPIAFEGNASPLTLWGLLDIRLAVDVPNSGGEIVGFWDSFRDTADIAAGRRELPWNLQWIGHPKVWFSGRNLLLWAIGWPMIAAAVGAAMLMLWRGLSRKSVPIGLVAAAIWSVLVFLYYSSTYMKYTRYHLMITPFVALCAAWFGVELWRYASTRFAGHRAFAVAALSFNGFVLGATTLWAVACASIYTRPHPRLEATRWLREHLEPQAALATESLWDDVVPLGSTGDLQMLDLRLYDADDAAKRQHLLQTLTRAQYIIVSSNRVWGSVPRLPQRWPLTTAYYYALFEGRLGFQPIREWTSYPRLNFAGRTIEFPDDNIEESLSVYDHPRVVLFKKTDAFSLREVEGILDPTLLGQRQDTPLIDLIRSGWAPDEASLPQLPHVSTAH